MLVIIRKVVEPFLGDFGAGVTGVTLEVALHECSLSYFIKIYLRRSRSYLTLDLGPTKRIFHSWTSRVLYRGRKGSAISHGNSTEATSSNVARDCPSLLFASINYRLRVNDGLRPPRLRATSASRAVALVIINADRWSGRLIFARDIETRGFRRVLRELARKSCGLPSVHLSSRNRSGENLSVVKLNRRCNRCIVVSSCAADFIVQLRREMRLCFTTRTWGPSPPILTICCAK